jgi:hypothetical protein
MSKIILLLVISSLIIGCIDAPKSISTKNIIPETISDITDKILTDCGTTIQCDNWVETHINGNYVKWNGVVSDATNDVLIVSVQYNFPTGSIGGMKTYNKDAQANVRLHDLSKEELLKFRKGDKIQFTGKINIRKDYTPLNDYYDSWIMMTSMTGSISLSDATIIQENSGISDVKPFENNKVPTDEEITKGAVEGFRNAQSSNSGISYHIDTSPPGKGVVYINNKISPTTGTLPPGSYNIKLVVGSKTYESTVFAKEGGSIELIQPVE